MAEMRIALSVQVFLAVCAIVVAEPITLLEPNGGQIYHVGDTMRIRWVADSSAPLVFVEMSVDNGGDWYRILDRSVGMGGVGWGDTLWVITDSVRDASGAVSTVSNQCLVRIRNYVDQITEDRSDGTFTILPSSGGVRGKRTEPVTTVSVPTRGMTVMYAPRLFPVGQAMIVSGRVVGKDLATGIPVWWLASGIYLRKQTDTESPRLQE